MHTVVDSTLLSGDARWICDPCECVAETTVVNFNQLIGCGRILRIKLQSSARGYLALRTFFQRADHLRDIALSGKGAAHLRINSLNQSRKRNCTLQVGRVHQCAGTEIRRTGDYSVIHHRGWCDLRRRVCRINVLQLQHNAYVRRDLAPAKSAACGMNRGMKYLLQPIDLLRVQASRQKIVMPRNSSDWRPGANPIHQGLNIRLCSVWCDLKPCETARDRNCAGKSPPNTPVDAALNITSPCSMINAPLKFDLLGELHGRGSIYPSAARDLQFAPAYRDYVRRISDTP